MAASIYVITNARTDSTTHELIKLLDSPLRDQYSPLVVCFAPLNYELKRQFEQIAVPVCIIERDQPRKAKIVLQHLIRHWREHPPAVIHGWDYAGNILATVLWRLSGRKAHLIWALPNHTPPEIKGWKARLILKLNQWLSDQPQRLLFKKIESLNHHQALGYQVRYAKVLTKYPLDLPEIYPQHHYTQRQALLNRLHLSDDTFLIGCITRFEPSFDYQTLLQAAALASLHYPNMRWIWAGSGLDYDNKALYQQIKNYGLEQHVFLLGNQSDSELNDLVSAFDLATLASRLDHLPTFLIKAMAYAIPVVATEVKALNPLVNATGTLVPHAQPQCFSAAWGEYYHMSHTARRACGLRARQQVLERYTLQSIVDSYQTMFSRLTTG
ncbi:glycosyltransferase [Thiofilum flexile]|uniref:glycosyltransferase n=1 Tax=Thiofilum flexile TaxID=125627 RepID=UPI000376B904|nr:glycosyltransferase [Thiofilum flexile]